MVDLHHQTSATVLIVDDEPINILAISSMLELKQIPHETALNGDQALQKIRERLTQVQNGTDAMYKLILLDYSLGSGMDGPEVSREIREMMMMNLNAASCFHSTQQ